VPRAFLAVLLILFTGCAAEPTGAPLGAACTDDRDCASGLCRSVFEAPGVCTRPCDTDACPDSMACARFDDGQALCATPCEQDGYGYVCVDGAPTACGVTDAATSCAYCEDRCSAEQYCDNHWRDDDAAATCQSDRAVGEACRSHEECASRNCSTDSYGDEPAGVCYVPAGAACTEENCGSCDPVAGGTECAQTCRGLIDCDYEEECLGSEEAGYYCREVCTTALFVCHNTGFTCRPIQGGTKFVCLP